MLMAGWVGRQANANAATLVLTHVSSFSENSTIYRSKHIHVQVLGWFAGKNSHHAVRRSVHCFLLELNES